MAHNKVDSLVLLVLQSMEERLSKLEERAGGQPPKEPPIGAPKSAYDRLSKLVGTKNVLQS
jgi:hypothetical protein